MAPYLDYGRACGAIWFADAKYSGYVGIGCEFRSAEDGRLFGVAECCWRGAKTMAPRRWLSKADWECTGCAPGSTRHLDLNGETRIAKVNQCSAIIGSD
jgi:hypothetical protein